MRAWRSLRGRSPEGARHPARAGCLPAHFAFFAASQSFLLISRKPCPLQEFCPLQALFAPLHADCPLQALTPLHWTVPESAATAVSASTEPNSMAAAAA